jgi:hypothetical protein
MIANLRSTITVSVIVIHSTGLSRRMEEAGSLITGFNVGTGVLRLGPHSILRLSGHRILQRVQQRLGPPSECSLCRSPPVDR